MNDTKVTLPESYPLSISTLQSRVEELEEALGMYADKTNWEYTKRKDGTVYMTYVADTNGPYEAFITLRNHKAPVSER